jgi:hypothetical protein
MTMMNVMEIRNCKIPMVIEVGILNPRRFARREYIARINPPIAPYLRAVGQNDTVDSFTMCPRFSELVITF